VLDVDVLFTPLLLDRLKWHPAPDALLFDRHGSLGSEELKVRLAGPYVVDVSRQLRSQAAVGEVVGLLKFGPEGGARLARVLDTLVSVGEVDARVPRAVTELAHRWPVVGVDTDGLPWTRVDAAEDLCDAEQVVASDIEAPLPPALALSASHLSQSAGTR
jgi:choline kinase